LTQQIANEEGNKRGDQRDYNIRASERKYLPEILLIGCGEAILLRFQYEHGQYRHHVSNTQSEEDKHMVVIDKGGYTSHNICGYTKGDAEHKNLPRILLSPRHSKKKLSQNIKETKSADDN
jgi:hypothetical protein